MLVADDEVTVGHGHFLGYRKERIDYLVVRPFRDWLMAEALHAARAGA